MTAKKSDDVTTSEHIPQTVEVYPLEDLHGLTDNDLLSVVTSGILTRPLIREQVNEVLKTKSVTNDDGSISLVYVYDESVIMSALSAAIKKVLLLECSKATDSAIHFTTYRGRICLTKEPTNEDDSPFTKSNDKHVCISGVIAKSRMKFIKFNVNDGKISKDDINTLDGIRLSVMIVESVGLSVFRQMITSKANLSSNLSEEMKMFVRDFNPTTPRPIVLVFNELKADADKADDKRMSKEDYLADIHELAIHIKNEAKSQDIVTSTRSRMLVPNICFALMERFKRKENFD